MARYDRITPLAAPVRDRVFAGWAFFRDLEGTRDPDLGRRARLRFLAYRPLRRLLDHGITGVPAASYVRQLDSVQEELGILGARDAERIHLAGYLQLLRQRTPQSAAEAALKMGAHAESRGHNHAAAEFYSAALEAAAQHSLEEMRVRALLRIAALAVATGAAGAESALREALDASAALPEEMHRVEALELAASAGAGARAAEARDELSAIAARGSRLEVRARAAAARARIELAGGRVARALEACWHSFIALNDADQRFEAARTLASALSRMGQLAAADLCIQRAAADVVRAGAQLRLRVDAACVAGLAGDPALFHARRAEFLAELEAERVESVFYTEAHLDLATAALECQSLDFARDHLRLAIDAARLSQRATALTRAESLLSRLEQPIMPVAERAADERGVARRIAAAITALSETLTTAGS